ncbi:MAG: anhydro-N-acetylmuramic acid kinase [Sphingomonadales bacterium]
MPELKSPAASAQLTALGLMSGTSLDGVDAAIVRTDGKSVAELGPCRTTPFSRELRGLLRTAIQTAARMKAPDSMPEAIREAELAVTDFHADAIQKLRATSNFDLEGIDVIGFHGQTILHRPERGWTWQIGDGRRLAELTGIDVVCDFRSADVAAGGEGAPLAPLYHQALAGSLVSGLKPPQAFPVAVLNIGGVANVTWISGSDANARILAFDTGPGNALINDWMTANAGELFDRDGATAAQGRVDQRVLTTLLDHAFFGKKPPKSLDRNDFSIGAVGGLSIADGAATLTEFTAAAVAEGANFFAEPVRQWIVCGGGRHNKALMAALARRLEGDVAPVEIWGWRGDALEAETFAFLAVRSLKGLPLSLPSTTGARRAITGGGLFPAP